MKAPGLNFLQGESKTYTQHDEGNVLQISIGSIIGYLCSTMIRPDVHGSTNLCK